MPVLTIGIVRDCFYLLIFYSEKFSTWVWRLPFAVIVNLSDKSQNQETEFCRLFQSHILVLALFEIFLDRFPSLFINFNWWNPHPFIYLKPESGTPFWVEPPCVPWAIKGSTSLPVTLRLQQIELWSLFTDSFTPVLPCLLPVPDRVVPLRMCWTYRRSKGKMVLSSVSKPDETTEKRRTT